MTVDFMQTLGVDEARRRLPEILTGFAEHTRDEPVAVGSYRRPQGVIISLEEYREHQEFRRRAREAAAAIASVRAEGGEPSSELLVDLQLATVGDLGDEELVERALRRHRRA